MTIIPNFLRNHQLIVDCLYTEYQDKFKPRIGADIHQSVVAGISSKFKTLKDRDMDAWFIDLLFKDCDFDPDLRDLYNFIQVQKYDPGDSITVHKDLYDIRKLHLVVLTTSDSDGLCYEDEGHWNKIYDKAGTYIDVGDRWHFVGPVRDLRYTLVITE